MCSENKKVLGVFDTTGVSLRRQWACWKCQPLELRSLYPHRGVAYWTIFYLTSSSEAVDRKGLEENKTGIKKNSCLAVWYSRHFFSPSIHNTGIINSCKITEKQHTKGKKKGKWGINSCEMWRIKMIYAGRVITYNPNLLSFHCLCFYLVGQFCNCLQWKATLARDNPRSTLVSKTLPLRSFNWLFSNTKKQASTDGDRICG